MSTSPPELANPNLGMDKFITGLQEAGMDQAVETVKTETPKSDEAIAPATTPPNKEAPPVETPKAEPKKETVAPKEQPKPATEDEEKKWPRNAKDWEAYKKADKERLESVQRERDEIKAERDRVKSEIEQLKKSGPSPELESLKKEKAELDEQLRLVAVQNHPKFKAYFDNKVGAQLELAKRIVGTEREKQIVDLLSAPDGPLRDKQLEELSETLNSLQQGRLAGVINNITQIQAERESEIAKARENYDQLQKQQQESTLKQQQDFQRLFDSTIKLATDPKDGNPAFQKREGDDAWNTDVDQRLETAKTLLFGNPKPEVITKAALAAVAYPAVLKQLQSTIQENESLKGQLKELQTAAPKLQTGKSSETTTTGTRQTPVSKPGHTDPMSAVGNWMKATFTEQE
jgi:hypothetical protein